MSHLIRSNYENFFLKYISGKLVWNVLYMLYGNLILKILFEKCFFGNSRKHFSEYTYKFQKEVSGKVLEKLIRKSFKKGAKSSF